MPKDKGDAIARAIKASAKCLAFVFVCPYIRASSPGETHPLSCEGRGKVSTRYFSSKRDRRRAQSLSYHMCLQSNPVSEKAIRRSSKDEVYEVMIGC